MIVILEQGCRQFRNNSDPERMWMFVHDEDVQERFKNGTSVALMMQSVQSMRQFVTFPEQPGRGAF